VYGRGNTFCPTIKLQWLKSPDSIDFGKLWGYWKEAEEQRKAERLAIPRGDCTKEKPSDSNSSKESMNTETGS